MSDMLSHKKVHKITSSIISYIYDEIRELNLWERMTVTEYLRYVIEDEAQESLREFDDYKIEGEE